MTVRDEDFLFAQEAQRLGFIKDEQVTQGLTVQKRMAEDLLIEERLAVILVKRGWMTEDQARRVYGVIEPGGRQAQIPGYRLVEKLGSGAMGTVYKAVHRALHRMVAIKVLHREHAEDKTQIARLREEAKLLASLDHPNIVRVIDAGEASGFPYYVMEYVEGETLKERIKREGPLEIVEALRITRALADALEKARRMGVVHRDVKPGNVLISKRGVPKLMDLGLAKGPIDLGLTQHGATVGTPQFISPEQAEDPSKADTRSDIYSLGATLYAMVTSKPPFDGRTLAEIITKVLYEQPVPPRVHNSRVGSEVSYLIERMMLKDASLRHKTPLHVVQDIDRIVDGRTIVPEGFTGNWEGYLLRQRVRTWGRRVAIGAMVAAAIGFTLYKVSERRTKTQARAMLESARSDVLDPRNEIKMDDSLGALNDKLNRVKRARSQVVAWREQAGKDVTPDDDIEERVRRLATAVKEMTALEALIPRVAAHQKAWKFASALSELTTFSKKLDRFNAPVLKRVDTLTKQIRDASSSMWEREVKKLKNTVPDEMSTYARHWEQHVARMQRPHGDKQQASEYVETKAWKTALVSAQQAQRHVSAMHRALSGAVSAFTGPALKRRMVGTGRELSTLDLHKLELDWEERAASLASICQQASKALAASSYRLPVEWFVGRRGALRKVTDRVSSEMDGAVRGLWSDLKRGAETALPSEDTDAIHRVSVRVQRFAQRADRTARWPDLGSKAEQWADRLMTRQKSFKKSEQARMRSYWDRALAALQQHDAVALRALIARHAGDAAYVTVNDQVKRTVLVVEQLQDAGLRYLAERQKKRARVAKIRWRGVEQAAMPQPKYWNVRRVDLDKQRFWLSSSRSREADPGYSIRDIALDHLLGWARVARARLDQLAVSFAQVAALAPVASETNKDIRPQIERYRDAMLLFPESDQMPGWVDVLRRKLQVLEAMQRRREDLAIKLEDSAESFFAQARWHDALYYLKQLMNPREPSHFTEVVAKRREKLERRMRECGKFLGRDELQTLVPGSQPRRIARAERGGHDVHEFLFDFDTPTQLQNFIHGHGVLERQPGVTTGPQRGPRPKLLHLNKGWDEPVRDRPLSLPMYFDAAQPVTLEAKISFPVPSTILAFDIDGVRVAVCSADPMSLQGSFPDRAKPDPDGPALPDHNYYGLGRGVAFHESGGKTFGRMFPLEGWDWPRQGRGANYEKWASKAANKKHPRLFAFMPRRQAYVVRVERDRARLALFVDGKLIAERTNPKWARIGTGSNLSDAQMRAALASGMLQLLSWTPIKVESVRVQGVILDAWRKTARRKAGLPK